MSAKHTKKRKQDDEETNNDNDEGDNLSIEETNKLRASLGLAPLETDEQKVRDADDGTNEKIYNEDGFEFRHRKADNWADKKREQTIKEKLETVKAKRDIYSKVLKTKKLADSDDEDISAVNWIEKSRQKDEEAKKAAEREKMFNQLDEDLGVSEVVEKKIKRSKKRDINSDTAGLVVGHARDAFIEGNQILVLQDKGVLDDGDEVLINPNMLDDERHKKNVELRKRKDPHRNFDEDVDEFGNPKHFGVLAKYDEELEGVQKEQFRLNEKGGVDLEEEKREMDMYKKLKMAGKRLETLEMPKYQLASEFYTQEEMVSFRKVKKGKKEKNTRKRKILKASDLKPIETAAENKSRDFGRRKRNDSDEEEQKEIKNENKEDNESENEKLNNESNEKWTNALQGNGVDLARLQKLKEKTTKFHEEEEDSDDDLIPCGGVDLTGIIIEDDAEDELHNVLSKTRKVKQVEIRKNNDDVGKKVQEMLSSHGVKMEIDEDEDFEQNKKDGTIFIDSTMEYCRHIGEIKTLGLGGNRNDQVDVSDLKTDIKEEVEDMEEGDEGFDKWKRAKIDRELKEKAKRKKQDKGGWLAAGKPVSGLKIDSDDEEIIESAKKNKSAQKSEDEDDEEYEPVLGQEADVSKGVGAMLKLAAQKGYLNNGAKTYTGPSLDHLKNKVRTQIDNSKHDIEDKYIKKLDRLGTTGRGPLQTFPEKSDYKPEVNITYVDRKGRDMDAKDAYRELSYKFHGRNPGKKQLEKRANKKDKEERMLKTNSYDTPLGTLSKQLKKQKQLSTPYLVISGSTDHSTLKKE